MTTPTTYTYSLQCTIVWTITYRTVWTIWKMLCPDSRCVFRTPLRKVFGIYTHTHTFSQGQSNNMALIQKSSDELMHEMRNCFDKNFDKLEIYILKNIFHVPGEVCLKYGVRHLSLSLSLSTITI